VAQEMRLRLDSRWGAATSYVMARSRVKAQYTRSVPAILTVVTPI